MTYDEQTIRETIAALGLDKALEQPNVRAAYDNDPSIREFALALEDVDALLPDLADLTPPPELVESTLARIESRTVESARTDDDVAQSRDTQSGHETASPSSPSPSSFVGERGASSPDSTPDKTAPETGLFKRLYQTGFFALAAVIIVVLGMRVILTSRSQNIFGGDSEDAATESVEWVEEEAEEGFWDEDEGAAEYRPYLNEQATAGDEEEDTPFPAEYPEGSWEAAAGDSDDDGEWYDEPEEPVEEEREYAPSRPGAARAHDDIARATASARSGAVRGLAGGRAAGGDGVFDQTIGGIDRDNRDALDGLVANGPQSGQNAAPAIQQPMAVPPADTSSSTASHSSSSSRRDRSNGTTDSSAIASVRQSDDEATLRLGGNIRDERNAPRRSPSDIEESDLEAEIVSREADLRSAEESARPIPAQEIRRQIAEEQAYAAQLGVAAPEPEPEPEIVTEPSGFGYAVQGQDRVIEVSNLEDDEFTTTLTSETAAGDILDLLAGSETLSGLDNEQTGYFGEDGQAGLPFDENGSSRMEWLNERYTDASVPIPDAAIEFFESREVFADVETREATGYWRNTYIPGDTNFRRLYEQSAANSDGPMASLAGRLGLFGRRQAYDQPFDAPTDDALSVFLSADRSGIDGESRVRVQVGIQASEQASGRRPTMNVMVVMDRPETWSDAQARAAQSYLEEMSSLHETGDAMGVIVAGDNGGTLIPPGRMGYGEVAVASRQLFGDAELELAGYRDLTSALREGIGVVAGGDDDTAPLGGALVVVMTPFGPSDTYGLERAAHEGAVNGVTTSIVALSAAADTSIWTDIALSGQGTLRLGTTAEEAEASAEEELFAASRIVARAVRLRIRLAPGVQLVDVLGSERLDEQQAQRVREQEQAVDQRLSRALGIQADRGEDEDGIQIVIPAFYAGDSHVILLDVVAPAAGPIADVQIRYKDLTQLRNGLSRVSLALDNRERDPGPLQVNVLKNHIGHELSVAYAEAAELVTTRGRLPAQQRLEEALGLVIGAPLYEPQLVGDLDLAADAALLQSFVDALSGRAYADNTSLRSLLELAGFMKLMDTPLHADTSY